MSLDSSGNFRWASNFIDATASYTCVVKDIAFANGIVSVAGQFNNSLDIDPSASVNNVVAAGNYDNFIVGLASTIGNLAWGGRIGGPQVDDIRSICSNSNGDFWINGMSQGIADLDPNPNSVSMNSFGTNPVPWVIRLNNNGAFQWTGNQGGQFLNGTYDNSITTSNGAIYWMGNVSNFMDLDPIGNTFFTLPSDYYSGYITKLCMPVQTYLDAAICPGDSVFVQGAWQTLPGSYVDVYQRLNGCDSSVYTQVYNANLNLNLGNDTAFCTGQLFLSHNAPGLDFLWNTGATTSFLFVDSSGTYYLTVSNPLGNCSVIDTIHVIYGLGVSVTLSDSIICFNSGNYILPQGNPSGGTWSGLGVTGNQFNPMTAGIGYHWLNYSVTDTAGCSGSDSVFVHVDICNDQQELFGISMITLQPNPVIDFININIPHESIGSSFILTDNCGKIVLQGNLLDENSSIDLTTIAQGIYYFRLENNDTEIIKVIKL